MTSNTAVSRLDPVPPLGTLFVFLLNLSAVSALAAQEPSAAAEGSVSPPASEVAEAYLEAHNAHDVSEAARFLAEDAILSINGGQGRIEGREGLLELEAWNVAIDGRFEWERLQETAKVAVYSVEEKSRWNELLGLDSITFPRVEYHVADGKISRIEIFFDPSEARRVQLQMRSLIEWAQANALETLQQVLPGGRFSYDPELAPVWLDLMERWRASRSEEF